METLFDERIAAGLQYATFPLELIGLTLALFEVRFPGVTATWAISVPQRSRSGHADYMKPSIKRGKTTRTAKGTPIAAFARPLRIRPSKTLAGSSSESSMPH